MVVMVACRCHNHVVVMTTVVAASPRRTQNRPSELSRGPFCAAVRAEHEYGNENLPRAGLRL
eukprot:6940227-Alexandrium_andersonii.AAC.1